MKKYYLFIFLVCCMAVSIAAQNTLTIPAGQSVEIDNVGYSTYEVLLQTVGLREVDVSVVTKESGEQIRGFGLGKMGKEEVLVEQGSKLLLINNGEKNIAVKYTVSPSITDKGLSLIHI